MNYNFRLIRLWRCRTLQRAEGSALYWRRCSLLVASALLCAQCGMPEARLPQLPADDVAAELRREQLTHIRGYYAELHRVDTVAFRIRTANKADCNERVAALIGLYAATPQSLPRRYRSFSREALDLSWARPTVISVVDGSPAAQAGVVTGDEITSLNGELIPLTGTKTWMDKWLAANGVKPLEANIRSDGNDRTVSITPVIGCAIPVVYVTADEVNAYTDGKKIVIQSGIVELTKTDAQLATIIGHELAHANLGHLDKRSVNAFIGMAGGLAVDGGFALGGVSTGGAFTREFEKAGTMAFSVGFEREADYVGAYYAARAGYDLTGAEEIWRAMGMKHPRNIGFASTHPTSPVRFVQMQKAAAEIADKQRKNLPLIPDVRFRQADQPPSQTGEEMR